MLLTDEEINDIDNELVGIPEWINEADEYKSFLFSHRYFAKAQLKKLEEWGEEICLDLGHTHKLDYLPRHSCSECWQSLIGEIE